MEAPGTFSCFTRFLRLTSSCRIATTTSQSSRNGFFNIFIFYFIYDCLPLKSFFSSTSFPSRLNACHHARCSSAKSPASNGKFLLRKRFSRFPRERKLNSIIKRIKNAVKLIMGEREKSLWCRVHMRRRNNFPRKFHSASPQLFYALGVERQCRQSLRVFCEDWK